MNVATHALLLLGTQKNCAERIIYTKALWAQKKSSCQQDRNDVYSFTANSTKSAEQCHHSSGGLSVILYKFVALLYNIAIMPLCDNYIQIHGGHKDTSPDFLGDYCDGLQFNAHSLYASEPTALQLILYYDELELCNPLGSRRKKHKVGVLWPCSILYSTSHSLVLTGYLLGAFYYMLGNLRPQLRSRINTIQLLLLAKYDSVAEFGIDRMLEPIVEDICKLESVSCFRHVHIMCIYACVYSLAYFPLYRLKGFPSS